MREIKFRGWTIEDGDKKTGHLTVDDHENPRIQEKDGWIHYVVPETVGQRISIQGVEMYEGDSILVHQFLFEGVEVEKEFKGNVVYIEEVACFGVKVTEQMDNSFLEHTGYETLEEMEPFCFSSLYGLHEESFKVIGNIHNKKLLTNGK